MEGWAIPILSVLVVIEWTVIVVTRRTSIVRTVRRDGTKLTFLDLLILLTAVALFVSSWTYVDEASLPIARIALSTLRVVLLLSGAWILWSEWRQRAGIRDK